MDIGKDLVAASATPLVLANQQRQWQVVNETLRGTPFESSWIAPQGI